MIGRFVEQEDVRPSKGQRSENHAGLLSTGELRDRNEVSGPVQPELPQHLLGTIQTLRG